MFLNPTHIIAEFDLQSGSKVADFGAGGGAVALAAARAVGSAGRVYAIDVQKDLLERLKKEARDSHLHNLEVLWGDVEKQGGTHLKDGAVDAVILSNILFQLEDKQGAANEAKRILKSDGKVLVVDWSSPPHQFHPTGVAMKAGVYLSDAQNLQQTSDGKNWWGDRSFGNMGPEPKAVVAEGVARALFEQSGFQFVKSISAGAHHYGMIFKKI